MHLIVKLETSGAGALSMVLVGKIKLISEMVCSILLVRSISLVLLTHFQGLFISDSDACLTTCLQLCAQPAFSELLAQYSKLGYG